MNKLIFTGILIVCSCYHTAAQTDVFALGLKAGLNYSNVYDSQGDDFNADPKYGFAGGAFLTMPIGKYFGVQPEILVSQKGFKATGRVLGGTYGLTRTTTYIDVPLLFAVRPVKYVNILFGPQFSYLAHRKDVFDYGVTSVLQEQEFKNDDLRKNTLCFTGGFDIGIKRVVLSARAGWDVRNNLNDGNPVTPRYKNTWIQGTLGFNIL
jgi:Outer membrane protein beta-barrel domain